MTQPQNGEWYQASDGNWYCWPDPTPHSGPPAPSAAEAAPSVPSLAPEPTPTFLTPVVEPAVEAPPWISAEPQTDAPPSWRMTTEPFPTGDPAADAFAAAAAGTPHTPFTGGHDPFAQPGPVEPPGAAPFPGTAGYSPYGGPGGHDPLGTDPYSPVPAKRGGPPVPPVLLVLLAVLVLAAAGWFLFLRDDGNDELDTTATPTPRASATASSVVPADPALASDTALAKALAVKAADLPSSWTPSAHADNPADNAALVSFHACLGAPDPRTGNRVLVSGPDFADGTGQAVASYAALAKDKATADAVGAAVNGPKFIECAKTEFARQLAAASGGTVDKITITKAKVPKYGDTAVRYRTDATIKTATGAVAVQVDHIFLVRGRSQLTISFQATGKDIDDAAELSMLAKAGLRFAEDAA